jgi:hypothetical protein
MIFRQHVAFIIATRVHHDQPYLLFLLLLRTHDAGGVCTAAWKNNGSISSGSTGMQYHYLIQY